MNRADLGSAKLLKLVRAAVVGHHFERVANISRQLISGLHHLQLALFGQTVIAAPQEGAQFSLDLFDIGGYPILRRSRRWPGAT
jgi:hypothetical protein